MHFNSLTLILHFFDYLVLTDLAYISLNSFIVVWWLAVGTWPTRFLWLDDSTQDANPCIQVYLPDLFDWLNFLFSNSKSKKFQRLIIHFNLFEAIISDSLHSLQRKTFFRLFFFLFCIYCIKVYQVIVLVSYQCWTPRGSNSRNRSKSDISEVSTLIES